MAEKTHKIEVKLAAKDETGNAFKSALTRIKEFNQEERASGNAGIEKFVKGGAAAGGVMFGIEALGAGAQSLTEAMKAMDAGTMDASQAIGHVVESGVKAIPILGGMTDGFGKIGIAAHESELGVLRWMGVIDEARAQELKSPELIAEDFKKLNAGFDQANQILRQQIRGANLVGMDPIAAEIQRKRDEADQQQRDLEKQKRDAVAGTPFGEDRIRVENEFNQAMVAAREKSEAEIAQIEEDRHQASVAAEKSFRDQIRLIQGTSDAQELQSAGLAAQAEIKILREQTNLAVSELMRRAEEEHKIRSGSLVEASAKADAMQEAARRREASILDEEYRRKLSEQDKFNRDAESLTDAAITTHLRSMGRAAEAEQKQLEDQHRQTMADLLQQQDDRIHQLSRSNSPDSQSEQRRVNEEFSKLRRAEDEKFKADMEAIAVAKRNAAINQQESVASELAKAKIGLLQTEAGLGNQIAGQEAHRLQIQEDANSEIAKYNRQLRETSDLTEQQREAIQQSRDIAIVQRDLSLAKMSLGAPVHAYAPGGELGRGQIGVGAAAEARVASDRAGEERQLLAQAREQVENLKAIRAATEVLQRVAPNLELFLQQQTQLAGTGTGGDLITDSNF